MADTPTDHESQYGDVEYADPKNHKYPINSEARVRAAWSYINMPKNQKGYTPGEVAAIKGKIKAAGKKYGITFAAEGGGRSMPADSSVEHRLTFVRVEVRNISPDGTPSRQIGGYAAVFNRDSRNLGTFVERVAPSFFEEDRANGWPGVGTGVVCRYNHDNMFLLGTTAAGTLRLAVDNTGLDYTVDTPECRSDVLELTGRGDVAASSFSFAVAPGGDEWSHNDVGVTQRTLLGGSLVDVAPVGGALAAYPDATVALRSLAAYKHADPADVFALAQQHELRRLFIRTDIESPAPPDMPPAEPVDAAPAEPADAGQQLELDVQPHTMSGAYAWMHILGRRADDPINVQPRPTAEKTTKEGVRP